MKVAVMVVLFAVATGGPAGPSQSLMSMHSVVTSVMFFIENDVRDLTHLKLAKEEVDVVFTRFLAN